MSIPDSAQPRGKGNAAKRQDLARNSGSVTLSQHRFPAPSRKLCQNCHSLKQNEAQSACTESTHKGVNRRLPEITGEDNLTVFSYSWRVKSPECRWQRRRADLRHFEIFRHGPIMIYARLPAGGTYYPICTFPASSECLIGISDAFFAFCLRVSVIFPTCSMYPQQKRAYSALH